MAAEKLNHSRKPLIYFGGGVLTSGAEAELLALAEKQDIPVCASMMGLGGFPPRPSLVAGHGGHARALWRPIEPPGNAMYCWYAGPAFPTGWRGAAPALLPNAQVIHLDIDHAEFDKNVTAAVRGGRGI